MVRVQRPVLARAAAAGLALGLAFAGSSGVERELARRGAERAQREAVVCAQPPSWEQPVPRCGPPGR
ncbi:hypothetical protein ACIQBJ_17785 [Kitasatospora sp. NPDC088391]|uniref:hypothetical protein n=1 Tax=Kitasatospora sp. NPDC088391 TaxID=3364074 RepID=UPI0037FEC319